MRMWRDLNPYQKKLTTVFGGGILLYVYLNFGRLDMNLVNLPFEMMQSVFYVVFFQFDQVPANVKAVVLDGLLCVGGLWFWVFFFAQFALPTHTIDERSQAVNRVFGGSRGPAIFIRDGIEVVSEEEKKRIGPGVIFIDSASAALLQTKDAHTRAVGPGLEFTQRFEQIASPVDLRTQVRILGPKDDDVVFVRNEADQAKLAAEDPDDRKVRERRRALTSGLTRDGLEVVPRISVVFRLDADRYEGQTVFGYRGESVIKAIRHEPILTGTGGEKAPETIPWDWLPAHLAADLWREYLRKFTLNELFEISPHKISQGAGQQIEPGKTVFEFIVHMIKARLTQETVMPLNNEGEPIEGVDPKPSRENKLMRDHGVKILNVSVQKLQMKDEDKLIDRWKATWLQRANEEAAYIDKSNEFYRQQVYERAQAEYSDTLAGPLAQEILKNRDEGKPPLDKTTSLNNLLRGTRTAIIRDANLNRRLVEERASIDVMIEWLQDYQDQNGAEKDISTETEEA